MTPEQIVTSVVSILVSGINSFAQGLGTGIQQAVTNMFFTGTGENQQLSIYAVMILVFGAIALATGLTKLIFNWLGSLGN